MRSLNRSRAQLLRGKGALLLLLCLVTGLAALAATTVAAGSGETSKEEASLVELEKLRTSTSATFELPGGAREARIFQVPINYRDPSGRWRPTDESLQSQADGAGLTNGANSFSLDLPDRLGSAPVRLRREGEWVSSELLGPSSEPADVSGSVARYEAASPGTRFKLTSTPNGLKETIELDRPEEPKSFHFELKASAGVEPILEATARTR